MTAPTRVSKFDPDDHPGNVYEAFSEFIDSFKYEYEAIAKPPPAGTENPDAWIQLDKRKQFLGKFASRSLQRDFEDETTADERSTITFDATVTKLKARYKPSQNTTLAHYEFHKLKQQSLESYDAFFNRVKHEASFCQFTCGPACTVKDTLIRDQVIYGVSDDDIRKNALNEQWPIADLQSKGRKIEAATYGAAKIKKEASSGTHDSTSSSANVNRTRPGKYSKKGGKGQKQQQCKNCSNKSCSGGEKCFGYGRECFDCGGRNHLRGSQNCKKKKKQSEKTMRVSDNGKKERSDSSSSSDSESGEADVNRLTAKISAARFVAHVRRSSTKSRRKKSPNCPRYQVPVVIKEKEVSMFADTGADISVIPKTLADELDLDLVKTKMRIKPYGSRRRIRCVGYYVGPVRYGEEIANVGLYVVKGDAEALLSGSASEALGIISFHGNQHVRRTEEAECPIQQVYMSQFPSVFSGVGKMNNVKVKFHVDPSIPPMACPKKTIPYHLQPRLDKQIAIMEGEGVIEDHEGPAPWISNLVLVPKPDGGLRVTVDMREPNKAILDTGLPIPKPEDIRKEFIGCNFFTKMDFRTAFHQLELEEESRYLTVFPHNGKLKRHTRLTMGAKPASGELNKFLRPLFSDLPAVHIIHDDLVIATPELGEHEDVTIQVLEIIRKAGLTLNPDKCLFHRKEIPFWGMIISGSGVGPDPAKVEALRNASRPESKSELMSFLCMLQSNSEFIPNLSKETVHLREMTKKNVRFRWNKQCQKEFEKLRGLLCDSTLLTYFDTGLPTFVIVDAHKSGLSAILAQGESVETAKMISCASRATTAVERRYHQLDLEALAVDFGLRRFRQYLVGGPQCTVVTDHKPLISIFKYTRRGSIRTDRIKLRHQDLNYAVSYQPGSRNRADFLSRHATSWDEIPREWKEETKELEKTVWFLNLSPYSESVSLPNIIEETKTDSTLQQLIEYCKKGYIPKSAGEKWKRYRNALDSITVSDAGLLMKGEKIILPESLWSLAIDKAHQGGHPGETRMKTRVRNHFWIPDLNSLVKKKVSSCETCQRFTNKTTREPVVPQRTTGTAWEEVSIDLFGPLPNKQHVLVVQDIMSRFPTATIVPNTSSTPVIEALDNVYTQYGQPKRHRTDNGPPFNSEAFAAYSSGKGVEQVFSYPYHPQGNPCETFMKPLGKALKAAIYNRENAQNAIDGLLKAYRSTPHSATGVAPGDILFRHGYHTEFPATTCSDEEVDQATARDKEQKHSRTTDTNSSKKRTASTLKIGDKVLLRGYPKGKKFDPLYSREAAEIIQIESKGVLVRENNGSVKRRHKDDVKLYHEPVSRLDESDDEEETVAAPTLPQPREATNSVSFDIEDDEEHTAPDDAVATPPREPRPTRQKKQPERFGDFVLYRVLGRKGGEYA